MRLIRDTDDGITKVLCERTAMKFRRMYIKRKVTFPYLDVRCLET